MNKSLIYVFLGVVCLLSIIITEARIERSNIVLPKETAAYWNSISAACIRKIHKECNVVYYMVAHCEDSIDWCPELYDANARYSMRNDLDMLKKALNMRGIIPSKSAFNELKVYAMSMKYKHYGPVRRCFYCIDDSIVNTDYWNGNAPHRFAMLGEDRYIFIELVHEMQLVLIIPPPDRIYTYISRFNYLTVKTAEYYAYTTHNAVIFPVLNRANPEYSMINWNGNTKGACIEIDNGTLLDEPSFSNAAQNLDSITVIDRPFVYAVIDKKNDLLLYAGYLLHLCK